MPAPPPLISHESLNEALPLFFSPTPGLEKYLQKAQDAYWSWDDLRHRSPPPGLSKELVWHLLELKRRPYARELPHLRGLKGQSYRYCWAHDTMLRLVMEIEAFGKDPLKLLRESLPEMPEQQLAINSFMEEAIHSSLLEGAATTRAKAKAMLRTGQPPRNQGERMVLNNYNTMALLEEKVRDPLSPDMVREIHRQVTADTLEDPRDEGRIQQAGEERVQVESIDDASVLHRPPPAEELPARLKALCRFANETEPWMPPVLRACVLHFQLAHDHPFVDGNGRTARALFYWAMLRQEYPLFRHLLISRVLLSQRSKYARAFMLVEQSGDMTYFLIFHLTVLSQALKDFQAYLTRKKRDLERASLAVHQQPDLNLRQRLLLKDAIAHPDRLYTATGHMRWHLVTRQTALNDLNGLVEGRLLLKARSGKEFNYRPAPDLAQRVRREP